MSVIKGIKGVKDLLPAEMARWQTIEETARHLARLYGYAEIRVPIFEVTELFARSIGASTDIVEKEMYTFQDRDGKSLTLRPEGTAGVVRAFIEHNLAAVPTLQKYFYLGAMFRHERPQAGRLRQFHQFGVEYFGTASPIADVEVIGLLWRFFHDLRLPDLTLELNSLGTPEDRLRYQGILVKYLRGCESSLCSNCRRRIETNPLRVLDCKVPECRVATESAPRIIDHVSPSSREHFDAVLAGLAQLYIPYTLSYRLVRGLDYYTMTTFEVTSTHLGAQNAVGAGGRYDGLVSALGGVVTPAVGFAVGLERVALMMPEDKVQSAPPVVFVAAFGERGTRTGLDVLTALRSANVAADTDPRATTLKALLRQADRIGARYAIILGDDEVVKGAAILRDLSTKEQMEIPLSLLSRELVRRVSGPPEA